MIPGTLRRVLTFDYFVSPTGSSSNSGTIDFPWSLAHALGGAGGVIQPGHKIAVRGGTYSGTFTNTVNGTAVSPVIFRQYPTERATLSGNLVVNGSYTWFWGLEVVSPTPQTGQTNGVQSRSTGAKFINMVIHDAAGIGLTLFDNPPGENRPDQEAFGNIIYNNGNTNNLNHGMYTKCTSGYRRILDNITFNNWAIGIQAYGDAGDGLNTITMDGNTSFNNGCISNYAGGPTDLLIGGSTIPATGATITNNNCYRENVQKTADIGYYFSTSTNSDLVCTGNYCYGLMQIYKWSSATVSGNTVYSTTNFSANNAGQVATSGLTSNHSWANNAWYGDSTKTRWGHNDVGATYAGWKTATGFATPGTFTETAPPNKIIVRPNVYEPGRANITVFNWTGASTVTVDLSAIYATSQAYNIFNVQDFFGSAVTSGIYAGSPITLPMSGISAPVPISRGTAGPTSGPTFQVFVARLQGV